MSEAAVETKQEDASIRVFISYARNDFSFAERLRTSLLQLGIDARIDSRDLPFARKWQDELIELIRWADTVLFVISPDSMRSQWCHWELAQCEKYGKRVGPIVYEAVQDDLIPESLTSLQHLSFVPPNDFGQQLPKLVAQLRTDIEWIRMHGNYANAARSWRAARAEDQDSFLLRGAALESALHWLQQRPASAPAPTAEQLELLHSSQKAIEVEQQQRLRKQEQQIRESETKLANSLVMKGQLFARERRWGKAKASYREAFGYFAKHNLSPLPAMAGYSEAVGQSPDPTLWYMGADKAVSAMAISKDGRWIAAGTKSGQLLLWEAATGRICWKLDGHGAEIRSIRFDPSSDSLWSMAEDLSFTVSQVETGGIIYEFREESPLRICTATFVGDGPRIITLSLLDSGAKDARPFAGTMGYQVDSFGIEDDDDPKPLCFELDLKSFAVLPNGTGVFLGREDGAVFMSFDGQHKEMSMFAEVPGAIGNHPLMFTVHLDCMRISQSGTHILFSYNDGFVEHWDLTNFKPVSRVHMGFDWIVDAEYLTTETPREASCFAVSRKSGAIEVIDGNDRILLYPHADTSHLIRFLPQSNAIVAASGSVVAAIPVRATMKSRVVLDPDASFPGWDIAFTGGTQPILIMQDHLGAKPNKSMVMFDGQTGNVLTSHDLPVEWRHAFPIDADLVALRGIKSLAIFDLGTGTLRHSIELESSCGSNGPDSPGEVEDLGIVRSGVADSVSGYVAITESESLIRVIDALSGRTINRITDPDISSSGQLAFFPGAKMLAFANDRICLIWDVTTGDRISQVNYDIDGCFALATSSAGPYLAIGDGDGSIRFWCAGEMQLRLMNSIYAHDGPVRSVIYSPDGSVLVSGGIDHKIKFWNAQDYTETYQIDAGLQVWKVDLATNGDLYAGVVGDPKIYGRIHGIIFCLAKAERLITDLDKMREAFLTFDDRCLQASESYRLGSWYALQELTDPARAYLERAGGFGSAKEELAHLLRRHGEYGEAMRIYNDLGTTDKATHLWLYERAAVNGRATPFNSDYLRQLEIWSSLPKWKRLFVKKPRPPQGV